MGACTVCGTGSAQTPILGDYHGGDWATVHVPNRPEKGFGGFEGMVRLNMKSSNGGVEFGSFPWLFPVYLAAFNIRQEFLRAEKAEAEEAKMTDREWCQKKIDALRKEMLGLIERDRETEHDDYGDDYDL